MRIFHAQGCLVSMALTANSGTLYPWRFSAAQRIGLLLYSIERIKSISNLIAAKIDRSLAVGELLC